MKKSILLLALLSATVSLASAQAKKDTATVKKPPVVAPVQDRDTIVVLPFMHRQELMDRIRGVKTKLLSETLQKKEILAQAGELDELITILAAYQGQVIMRNQPVVAPVKTGKKK